MRISFIFFLLTAIATAQAQQTLDYFLKADVSYRPQTPSPQQYLGFQVAERHVTHEQLAGYMRAIAQDNPRVRLLENGQTHEGRPLLCLAISSPDNIARLESIQRQRRQLADPTQPAPKDVPTVVYMGYSIHGNEASGSNAALAVAYYLCAAQDSELETWLQDMVILLDPCMNPDGLQRFSNWVNSRRSLHGPHDGADDEFNEPWPGGRSNHYWFDLNRDWLATQHPESVGRVRLLQDWKPNVLTDHHEMGGNSTFFFQPGVPTRVHPLTPARNQELTAAIGRYHAEALSAQKVLFYSRENFDDYYYGKGSTYPDANGCVGILFEQASSRGSAQQTANGLLTFAFTVRNQCITSFSTLRAAHALRDDLNAWLREFYASGLREAARYETAGWVFEETRTPILREFLRILTLHGIETRRLATDLRIDGQVFSKESALFVPAEQLQYRLARAVFDRPKEFADSIFYDISAWTLPDAFGLRWSPVARKEWRAAWLGERESGMLSVVPPATLTEQGVYGLLLPAESYDLPRAVVALHRAGVRMRLATSDFKYKGQAFRRGSILIPMSGQSRSAESIYAEIQRSGATDVYCTVMKDGQMDEGPDAGSDSFLHLKAPRAAMLTGAGVSNLSAGEIWHLLDTRFALPLTKIDAGRLNQTDLSKYTTLIMPEGGYESINSEKIRAFVQGGGTLIGIGSALNWLHSNNLLGYKLRENKEDIADLPRISYDQVSNLRQARRLAGAIFEADLDLTHPLCYGYERPKLALFYTQPLFVETPSGAYNTPAVLGASPRLAGYVPWRAERQAPGAAAVTVSASGRGRVIVFAANPTFRGFWFGTHRMLANALLWGGLVRN
ncbi:MAG: M14 metallopeptidase family protein [Saprospiraceae bacterium]